MTLPTLAEIGTVESMKWGIQASAKNVLPFLNYYMPNYFYKPWGEFHRECADIFWRLAKAGSNERENIVAPRSVAKSTFFSVGLPIFAALYPQLCQKHFIVIISDTFDQTLSKLEAIKNTLETSEPILEDFGDLSTQFWSTERILAKGSKMIGFGGLPERERDEGEEESPPSRLMVGDEWEGTFILALGTQMKIRGRTFRQWRPDLFIIDDPQNDAQVMSATQREKDMEWLYNAVLPAGSVDGFSVLMLGTALHEECMVETIRTKDLNFNSRIYKMVKSWPEREDLWEKCRKIFINLELGKERKEKTMQFYLKHRAAMDKGFKLLQNWASDIREKFAPLDVMILLWTKGASFWRERQNEPALAGDRLFNWERFTKFSKELRKGVVTFTGNGRSWTLQDYVRTAVGIDPAEGTDKAKQKKGKLDFCAVVAMGLHEDGYRDVLEVRLKKQGAEAEIGNALDYCAKWGAKDLYVEANMYQGLATLFRKEIKLRGVQVRVHPVKNLKNKELRIATLEPDINSGWIRFIDNLPIEAQKQFNRFRAGAEYDDAPDVIEMTDRRLHQKQVRYMGDAREVIGEKKKEPPVQDAYVPQAGERKTIDLVPSCEGKYPYDGRNKEIERHSRLITYCRRFSGCEGCPISKFLGWKTPVKYQFEP